MRTCHFLSLHCVVLGFAISTVQHTHAADVVVSVTDFGAVANDGLDDRQAFNNAINGSNATHVMIPAGVFNLTDNLLIHRPIILRGQGVALTTIKQSFDKNQYNNANAAIDIRANDVYVEDLKLEGPGTDGNKATGFYAENRTATRIKNCEITGYGVRYGVHFVDCTSPGVEFCFIHDFMMNVGGVGAPDMIDNSPAGVRFTRCYEGYIRSNIFRRIEVGPSGRTSESELVPGYGAQGYQSDHITALDCNGTEITFNNMQTSGEGIDILLSSNLTVTDNYIYQIHGAGIKMLGTSSSDVSDNEIHRPCLGILMEDHPVFTSEVCRNNIIDGNLLGSIGSPEFGDGSDRLPGSYNRTGIVLISGVRDNVISNTTTINNDWIQHYIRDLSGQSNTFSNNN